MCKWNVGAKDGRGSKVGSLFFFQAAFLLSLSSSPPHHVVASSVHAPSVSARPFSLQHAPSSAAIALLHNSAACSFHLFCPTPLLPRLASLRATPLAHLSAPQLLLSPFLSAMSTHALPSGLSSPLASVSLQPAASSSSSSSPAPAAPAPSSSSSSSSAAGFHGGGRHGHQEQAQTAKNKAYSRMIGSASQWKKE